MGGISSNVASAIIALALISIASCGGDRLQTGEPCGGLVDSDGDTISDSAEGMSDPDGDGVPSSLDQDSDGDTFPDSEEAGDEDLCTPPLNTDRGYDSSGNPTGDDVPDFLDLDSDEDGLTDAEEHEIGTNPRDKDTDGDGVTDKGEVCFGTDPVDPTSTMDPDDAFVILPYMAPEHTYLDLEFFPAIEAPMDMVAVAEEYPLPHCHDLETDVSCLIRDIRPLDGYPDAPEGFASMDGNTFFGVNPGTDVTFRMDLYNDCVPPGETAALVGGGRLAVLGSGGVEVEGRDFLVIVPTEGINGWP